MIDLGRSVSLEHTRAREPIAILVARPAALPNLLLMVPLHRLASCARLPCDAGKTSLVVARTRGAGAPSVAAEGNAGGATEEAVTGSAQGVGRPRAVTDTALHS
jgi:hypothetical protein